MITDNYEFFDIFEKNLGEYTNAPYVVLVDSCTNAIFLALRALDIRDKLLTIPCCTYIGVPLSIKNSGNKVDLKEIDWIADKEYKIQNTNIYDCALKLEENMYRKGTIQCLSFQQKKPLNLGKGGAILLDDYDLYIKLNLLSIDGRNIRNFDVDTKIKEGYHMNMTPEQAMNGILKLNEFKKNPREAINTIYEDLRKIIDV